MMRKTIPILLISAFCLALSVAPIVNAAENSHAIDLCLSDVRVLYLYDNPDEIDWPTLYYLNAFHGCRVDLLTVQPRPVARTRELYLPEIGFGVTQLGVPAMNSITADSLFARIFAERRPDIVVIGNIDQNQMVVSLAGFIREIQLEPSSLFNIVKIFRVASDLSPQGQSGNVVRLNSNELIGRYKFRMQQEIGMLSNDFDLKVTTERKIARYNLIKNELVTGVTNTDFLTGINRLRLIDFIDSSFVDGPRKETYRRLARQYMSSFRSSLDASGGRQVDLLIAGFRDLLDLSRPVLVELATEPTEFLPYLRRLVDRAEEAALKAAGVSFDGRIILRDSPHGPRVKFRMNVSVDGPRELAISGVRCESYWDSSAIVLDSSPQVVAPHQSYLREYLVEIDREHLETSNPESLLFVADLEFASIQLQLRRVLNTRQIPDMTVRFDPPYHFVGPVASLDVDRVVSSMAWNITIEKPRDFAGEVKLQLETPKGIFAGAYRTEVRLEEGNRRETIRIPFTVSNLFEMGIHNSTITLTVDGQEVSSDVGIIRIARCDINDRRSIGFLPDTSGLLEDILRLTDARFRPLTDRTLQVGDLTAYNVIIIGSGALEQFPSFTQVRDRLEEFIRWGGSLVIMGQNDDWPDGALPFSLVPFRKLTQPHEINNPIRSARILTQPYKISVSELLGSFDPARFTTPAVVSPAEEVFALDNGALLSVSRLGQGQMIYCGLPLLELIEELDLQAIHLFANILNY